MLIGKEPSEVLRMLAKAESVTLKAFAEKIDVSYDLLRQCVSINRISETIVNALSRYYKCDYSFLLRQGKTVKKKYRGL